MVYLPEIGKRTLIAFIFMEDFIKYKFTHSIAGGTLADISSCDQNVSNAHDLCPPFCDEKDFLCVLPF